MIYHERVIIPLLKTAFKLSDEKTLFYMAFETHDLDAANAFFREAPNYFHITRVPKSDLDSFYQTEDIQVLCLRKRSDANYHSNAENDNSTNEQESSEENYSEDWDSDEMWSSDEDDDNIN